MWQRMDSAPKDGSAILLRDGDCDDGKDFIVIGFWGIDSENSDTEEMWRVKWNHEPFDQPHMWSPIPPIDNQQVGKADGR